jgi:hypothetical protein
MFRRVDALPKWRTGMKGNPWFTYQRDLVTA